MLLILLAACGVCRPNLHAQSLPAAQVRGARLQPWALPADVRHVVDGMGDRFRKPGRDRITVSGTLTDQRGITEVTMVSNLNGDFRFTEQRQDGRVLKAGPVQPARNLSEEEEALLESLAGGTLEAFLNSVAAGIPYRLLGRGFQSAAERGSPGVDIYEVWSPGFRNRQQLQRKLFCFQRGTGRLERVQYQLLRGGAVIEAQTVLSDWTYVDRQFIPTRISHVESGREVFSLRVSGAVFGPDVSDGVFSNP